MFVNFKPDNKQGNILYLDDYQLLNYVVQLKFEMRLAAA